LGSGYLVDLARSLGSGLGLLTLLDRLRRLEGLAVLALLDLRRLVRLGLGLGRGGLRLVGLGRRAWLRLG